MQIVHVVVEKVSLYNFYKKMNKYTEDDLKKELETKEYEYGFYTDFASETFPIGLNEEIVREISQKKEEPEWMTKWRLEAFSNLERHERT